MYTNGSQTKQLIKRKRIRLSGSITSKRCKRLYPIKSSMVGRMTFKARRPLFRPSVTNVNGMPKSSKLGSQ